MSKEPLDPEEEDVASADFAIGHVRDVLGKATGEKLPREKNPAAVALGKLGASKGGKARAQQLSARKRTEIAKRAAKKRWSKTE